MDEDGKDSKVSSGDFRTPERTIKVPEDMERWEKSQAYQDLMGFILILNEAVVGKTVSDDLPESPAISKLMSLLDTLDKWVDKTPTIDQPQRFGNKAFKIWWDNIDAEGAGLLEALLPAHQSGAVVELLVYFRQSFGNPTRIDYGTGHEFKFAAFLCCLTRLGVLPQTDAAALVLRVFNEYMILCRKLQTKYRMEPAGSHGVWGLDDFQFLPFIWGSSQLRGHPTLLPSSFVDNEVAGLHCKDYLFMACINYIHSVKSGPFGEHSSTLYGISAVHEWKKVNSGLVKMFKAEVLGKFPVIQHFPFGSILSIQPATTPS